MNQTIGHADEIFARPELRHDLPLPDLLRSLGNACLTTERVRFLLGSGPF